MYENIQNEIRQQTILILEKSNISKNEYDKIIRNSFSEILVSSLAYDIGNKGEYYCANFFGATIKPSTGYDLYFHKNIKVYTKCGIIKISTNEVAEVKTTTTIHAKKYKRVQKLLGKKGLCNYIIIYDQIEARVFLIPSTVFFNKAYINDIKHTQGFAWNADYIPHGTYAKNTEILLQYEVVNVIK